MTFVLIHLALFGFWITANTVGIPGVPKFDESLVVLAMEASVEAIFLSTFVLISQNRMADRQNRSADLDLHISLLAEHELTRVAMLLERIARKLEVSVDDLELGEIEADVEPGVVLDALEERQAERGACPSLRESRKQGTDEGGGGDGGAAPYHACRDLAGLEPSQDFTRQ